MTITLFNVSMTYLADLLERPPERTASYGRTASYVRTVSYVSGGGGAVFAAEAKVALSIHMGARRVNPDEKKAGSCCEEE